jgi:hypothetical protein
MSFFSQSAQISVEFCIILPEVREGGPRASTGRSPANAAIAGIVDIPHRDGWLQVMDGRINTVDRSLRFGDEFVLLS